MSSAASTEELQRDYLNALLAGSGRAADRVVQRALDAGFTPQRVYLDLFQPTAYAIGRLWQRNRVSVAQEHLATAIIERQMGELHPLFRPRQQRGRTVVIGCVPDEWHRVGARMVADFFEAEGWTVHYLGAAVPVRDLVAMVRDSQADLVGVSAQMLFNLPRVQELVRALDAAGLAGIPVIAGGMPFTEQPELAPALNVRGSGADAAAALRVAEEVLTSASPPPAPLSPDTTALTLERLRERIVAAATARCLADGDSDEDVIRAGFHITTRMLAAAIAAGTPAPLDAQVAWVNERQPHDGVAPTQILARLSRYAATLRDLLPGPEGATAGRYADYLITLQRRALIPVSGA
ncbi:MAG: cobalamin-dependent protein [Oscillochloridaceae bacterium]|nr:cobalamin-dependent protein [Chloroflexaceae bacterium]MDW8392239.1 cobalamin-dependent protein [Oscillochloridaceae bacterium]